MFTPDIFRTLSFLVGVLYPSDAVYCTFDALFSLYNETHSFAGVTQDGCGCGAFSDIFSSFFFCPTSYLLRFIPYNRCARSDRGAIIAFAVRYLYNGEGTDLENPIYFRRGDGKNCLPNDALSELGTLSVVNTNTGP